MPAPGPARVDDEPEAGCLLPDEPLARAYLGALLAADRQGACRLILDALERGVSIEHLYLRVFQPVQYELGRLWSVGRLSVAQEHYCTAVTQLVIAQLYPHLFTTRRNGRSLVAACVAGDLHELGARMVADFFELRGWNTWFSGADTPGVDLVEAVARRAPDVLALSASLEGHVEAVAGTIRLLRGDPRCDAVRVVVGGQAFNADPSLWHRVGADGWAADARQAVQEAERLFA